jgi:hypothetical protein
MAGFREFVTGEVLTAANVNDFLGKQAVMKFADAAARDAALGTAVVSPNALREGMVAYLDDEDAPSFYDGSAWGPISVPVAGIGSNVVQTVKTDTFTTTSTSFVNVTDLEVTITPSSATSKILVYATAMISNATSAGATVTTVNISRDTTGLVTFGETTAANDVGRQALCYSGSFLDSPATTSATTYRVRMLVTSGTGRLNFSRLDGHTDYASYITAIEVAA